MILIFMVSFEESWTACGVSISLTTGMDELVVWTALTGLVRDRFVSLDVMRKV